MRLLFCGSGWLPIVDYIRERLPAGASIVCWDRVQPLGEAVIDVDILLPSNAAIGADIIAAGERLQLIQQPAAGVDGIDLAAARLRGIPVCNAPAANHVAVAEAALLLMLALARRYRAAQTCFANRQIGVPLGGELYGKRLCIIGMGRTGGELAARARALGMNTCGITSRNERRELLALLGDCDYVSIHAPLTEHTRGMLDDEAFAAMKPGTLLVNCARGPIVDRDALLRALDRGQLGGVGLDVFWDEPWQPDDPLYTRDDVIVLPHIAGSTREAFARIADIVCENVRRLQTGAELLHRV